MGQQTGEHQGPAPGARGGPEASGPWEGLPANTSILTDSKLRILQGCADPAGPALHPGVCPPTSSAFSLKLKPHL